MLKPFVTISLLVAILSTYSAQAAGLEALFAGFEKGCGMNKRFFTFHESLVRKNKQILYMKVFKCLKTPE